MKYFFVPLLILILSLTSCGNKTVVEGDDDGSRVEVTSTGTGWCNAGSFVRSSYANEQGQIQQVNMKVVGKETITIGPKTIETCHLVQEWSEGTVSTESWTTEDGKHGKSIVRTSEQQLVTESWVDNGRDCAKMYDFSSKQVFFETCS